jgi:hypothetical protein
LKASARLSTQWRKPVRLADISSPDGQSRL